MKATKILLMLSLLTGTGVYARDNIVMTLEGGGSMEINRADVLDMQVLEPPSSQVRVEDRISIGNHVAVNVSSGTYAPPPPSYRVFVFHMRDGRELRYNAYDYREVHFDDPPPPPPSPSVDASIVIVLGSDHLDRRDFWDHDHWVHWERNHWERRDRNWDHDRHDYWDRDHWAHWERDHWENWDRDRWERWDRGRRDRDRYEHERIDRERAERERLERERRERERIDRDHDHRDSRPDHRDTRPGPQQPPHHDVTPAPKPDKMHEDKPKRGRDKDDGSKNPNEGHKLNRN